MVYRLDTPGVENQAITNAKIDTGAVSTQKVDASINNALVPINGIIMYSGLQADIPANWAICDGNNGTPNLVNKFVVAAASFDTTVTIPNDGSDSGWRTAVSGTDGASGGSASKTLGTNELPSHTHSVGTLTGTNTHNHDIIRGSGGSQASNFGIPSPVVENVTTPIQTEDETIDVTISGDTGDQGGTMGEAFDILPPYYAIAYIMRVS